MHPDPDLDARRVLIAANTVPERQLQHLLCLCAPAMSGLSCQELGCPQMDTYSHTCTCAPASIIMPRGRCPRHGDSASLQQGPMTVDCLSKLGCFNVLSTCSSICAGVYLTPSFVSKVSSMPGGKQCKTSEFLASRFTSPCSAGGRHMRRTLLVGFGLYDIPL